MKIGIYNLEPKIVNVALMKISQYHKLRGDSVEPYNLLLRHNYDKIYASSIFDFTDKGYVTSEMICGGSGFDVSSKLPPEIEVCDYDWDLYPDCDYSIIWFSQGCMRNCEWCIVREKEGFMHSVTPKNLNPRGESIKVMDNNFFANPGWPEAIKQLAVWNQPVDFQGIDVRLINEEQCQALKSLKLKRYLHIAWDNPLEDLEPKLREITRWIKPYRWVCYVLIGFNSTKAQDMHRVKAIHNLGMCPFVMPYNKKDLYQKRFARWVNHKAIFKTVAWGNYNQ